MDKQELVFLAFKFGEIHNMCSSLALMVSEQQMIATNEQHSGDLSKIEYELEFIEEALDYTFLNHFTKKDKQNEDC